MPWSNQQAGFCQTNIFRPIRKSGSHKTMHLDQSAEYKNGKNDWSIIVLLYICNALLYCIVALSNVVINPTCPIKASQNHEQLSSNGLHLYSDVLVSHSTSHRWSFHDLGLIVLVAIVFHTDKYV